MTEKKSVSKTIMVMHKDDNVAVCLRELKAGEMIFFDHASSQVQLETRDPIPLGHKVALKDIQMGKPIVKYGEIIGKATKEIAKGQHVHTHNVTDFS